MADTYNFSKHLRAIVKPALVAKSFKLKGTTFRRNTDSYIETVNFQRSRWNLPGTPSEFYLNLGIESDRLSTSGRAHRPTTLPIPKAYRRFMVESLEEFTMEQRNTVMHSFEPHLKAEVDRYVYSRCWLYSSESGLIRNFEIAVEFFNYGLDEIFSAVSNKLVNANNFAEGMQLISNVIEDVYIRYRP